MQKKNFLPILTLLAVLLTGAVGRYYVHEQGADGSAVLTLFWKTVALGDIDYEKLADACAQEKYQCSVNQENFSISVPLEKGKHYRFYAEYGFPDIIYTLELDAIGTDVLTEKIIEVLETAGQPVVFAADEEPLDITKKDPELSQMLRKMGDVSYMVRMPGGVYETSDGEKSGNTVTFMLSQAYAKDGGVIIKSRQLNSTYVLGVLMVLVLLAVSVYFLKERQAAKKTPQYIPKKPRSARKK